MNGYKSMIPSRTMQIKAGQSVVVYTFYFRLGNHVWLLESLPHPDEAAAEIHSRHFVPNF